MAELREYIRGLAERPGVYLFFDAGDRLLYVGKSVNLRNRVRSYFREDGGHSRRTARLKEEVARIETVTCGSELEALLLESRLIKQRLPLYNVMGRSYRHYPFIKIVPEAFPRVLLTYDLVDDGGRYFGPFPGELRAREVLEALRPMFRWRSCNPLANRVCFEQAIGRCAAPCVGLVEASGYEAAMADLTAFLGGSPQGVLARLEADMAEAAAGLRFERAAVLRDRLALLRPWVDRQLVLQRAVAELDALIVLPAVVPGATLWLLVRRGRLVHTEPDVTPRRLSGVRRRLLAALEAPPPSLAVRQEELDELNLLTHWLHRNRSGGTAVPVDPEQPEACLEAARAVAFTTPTAPR